MSGAMRFWMASLVCLACASAAVAKDSQGKKGDADRSAAIDELAQSIFASADRNHNQALNKSEFEDAQAMLRTKFASSASKA